MRNPTITQEDDETFHITLFDSVGAMGRAEILSIDGDDVEDADVCYATDEIDLAVNKEHLQRLFITLTEFFVGKREVFDD